MNTSVSIFFTTPWVTTNPSPPAVIFSAAIPMVNADPVSFKLYALVTCGLWPDAPESLTTSPLFNVVASPLLARIIISWPMPTFNCPSSCTDKLDSPESQASVPTEAEEVSGEVSKTI